MNKISSSTPSLFFYPPYARPIKIELILKLALVVIILSLLSACKDPLFTKIDEREANEMMSILLTNGIAADKILDKKDKTLSIHVKKSQLPIALRLLKQRGYPREKFKETIDIFEKTGLVSSPMEERVRFIYALTQEVQGTLSLIDGVVSARVHLVLPENDPFSEKLKPSSASVFIKSLPGSHLENIKPDITFIVEKSIEGLDYENISVVILPATNELVSEQSISWANVLGVRLPESSVGKFRVIIGFLFLAFICVTIFSIYLLKQIQIVKNTDTDTDTDIDPYDKNNIENSLILSTDNNTSWASKFVGDIRKSTGDVLEKLR